MLQDLRSDLALALEQVTAATPSSLDLRATLLDTIFPLLAGAIDELARQEESIADQGDAIDELINQDEDVLHPETAQQFTGVYEAGLLLAAEVEKIKGLDEVSKKKFAKLITAYRAGVATVSQIIAEITIPLDELEAPADGAADGDEIDDDEPEDDLDEDELDDQEDA